MWQIKSPALRLCADQIPSLETTCMWQNKFPAKILCGRSNPQHRDYVADQMPCQETLWQIKSPAQRLCGRSISHLSGMVFCLKCPLSPTPFTPDGQNWCPALCCNVNSFCGRSNPQPRDYVADQIPSQETMWQI